ncbi:hypothetical protein ACKGJO_12860 [Gracilimonas sp. Q87]|uniref:hypothetical protein n=1 Tax=Gracilimonas sp. Q87 TaxID=3384766 RepID=UPI003983DDCD
MRSLLIFLFTILPLFVIQAQVIDTSELNKLQSGQYKLAEGQLQVVFNDTTTLSFIQKELHSLGLQIKQSEFENVVMIIENHPEKDDIRSLQKNETVKMVINEASYLKSESGGTAPLTDISLQSIDPDLISDFKFKDQYQVVFVILEDNAAIKDADRIIGQYQNLKFNTLNQGRRAAVILTGTNDEDEIITLLESKPYVNSVAYMGIIE